MKFVYPKKGDDLDERTYAIGYGNYPLSSYNTWHGGIHLGTARAPLVAICGGHVIAYRLANAYRESEHWRAQKYSDGFVLVQHHHLSPEGQELRFYVLYHHLASKTEIESKSNNLAAPKFLSAPGATVTADKEPRGVRGRSPIGTAGSRGEEVALIPKNFIIRRNPDATLAPWAVAYNSGRAEGSRYHSYQYTDLYNGTVHPNIHIHASTLARSGGDDLYRVIYDSDGFTLSGGRATASLYPEMQKGALLLDIPDDGTGEPGIGAAIGVIPKGTEIKFIEGTATHFEGWAIAEGHNGYVSLEEVEESFAFADDVRVDTVVACHIPVASGEVIGYVGKFGFMWQEEAYASHVEVFSDEADGAIQAFLSNAKGDGGDTDHKYEITAGTKLEPYVKSAKELEAGTPVRVIAVAEEYAHVRVLGIIREVTNRVDIMVDMDGTTYAKADVAGENRIQYSIVPERFPIVNALFNGLLRPGDKVYLEEMVTGGDQRRVVIDTPDAGKEFWIDASALGTTPRAGSEVDLASGACCTYVGRPYPEPASGNTYQKDIEVPRLPQESVEDDDGKVWYLFSSRYSHGGDNYYHVGWLAEDSPNLRRLNPFDWTAYGFCAHEGGEEYVYGLADYLHFDATHAFVDAVWRLADDNGDRILTAAELLRAQRDPESAERMGKMVVKHKNEWSYTGDAIRGEAEQYYELGIEAEEDPEKKEDLIRERDNDLNPLATKVTDLMWWSEAQAAPYTPPPPPEETEAAPPADAAETDAAAPEEQEAKVPERQFPGSPNVWHWNPHSFVRQMRLIWGSDCKYLRRGDRGDLVKELNIRLNGFGGNVPGDEFTERTEQMVRQFQEDYMEVEPTGLVCGAVFRAIDDFEAEYNFNYSQLRCPCGTCSGFGLGKFAAEAQDANIRELRRKYEYPGMHRCLIYALKAFMFYMDKDTVHGMALNRISSGYRCHIDNANKGRRSTNHMGKAIDIQMSVNGSMSYANKVKSADLGRDEFFIEKMGAQLRWGGSNRISLEPGAKDRIGGEFVASTWVHFDVREFDLEYKEDEFFKKTEAELVGEKMIDLAVAEGYQSECSCSNSGGESTGENAANGERVDPSTLDFSADGVDFLKGYESEVKRNGLHVHYNDDYGFCTIGYGHLISGKRSCESFTMPARFASGLTDAQAEQLFRSDVADYVSLIQNTVTVDLSQNEFDALVSLTFNIGGTNWRSSTFLSILNQGNYATAADEFPKWRRSNGQVSNGLIARRAAEREIFLNNHYDSSH